MQEKKLSTTTQLNGLYRQLNYRKQQRSIKTGIWRDKSFEHQKVGRFKTNPQSWRFTKTDTQPSSPTATKYRLQGLKESCRTAPFIPFGKSTKSLKYPATEAFEKRKIFWETRSLTVPNLRTYLKLKNETNSANLQNKIY